MLTDICIFISKHIIGLIPITKTVNKNLIHDSTLSPLWGLKSRHYLKIVEWVKISHNANLVIITYNLSNAYFIVIIKLLTSDINICLIEVKQLIRKCPVHGNSVIVNHNAGLVDVVSCCSKPKLHILILIRLWWNSVFRTCITEYGMYIKYRLNIHEIIKSLLTNRHAIKILSNSHRSGPLSFQNYNIYRLIL